METYTTRRVCVKGDSWNGWSIQVQHTPGARLFAPPPAAPAIHSYDSARRMIREESGKARRRINRLRFAALVSAGASAGLFIGAALILAGAW